MGCLWEHLSPEGQKGPQRRSWKGRRGPKWVGPLVSQGGLLVFLGVLGTSLGPVLGSHWSLLRSFQSQDGQTPGNMRFVLVFVAFWSNLKGLKGSKMCILKASRALWAAFRSTGAAFGALGRQKARRGPGGGPGRAPESQKGPGQARRFRILFWSPGPLLVYMAAYQYSRFVMGQGRTKEAMCILFPCFL